MSDQQVELLRLQVQQLVIRVEILERRVGVLEESGQHGASSEFEFVSSAHQPSSPSRITSSSSVAYSLLAQEIPEVSGEVLRLCGNLRGGKLSFEQRAKRAWTAGWWARFVLEGRISKPPPSIPCDLANTTYVVIRAAGICEPVRVEKAADYRALVGDSPGSSSTSLAHGFASKAEAKVYCLGASIPYPEKLYQWS